MKKSILLVLMLIFALSSLSYATDTKQLEDDRIEKIFTKMLRAYKNKNMKAFFVNVFEKNFQQDYIEFYDAVEEDMRINDILSIQTWTDKIAPDGKKRFLYIKWEKRYTSIDSSTDLSKEGNSIFLFEVKKGRYKLIGFSGDLLFGVE